MKAAGQEKPEMKVGSLSHKRQWNFVEETFYNWALKASWRKDLLRKHSGHTLDESFLSVADYHKAQLFSTLPRIESHKIPKKLTWKMTWILASIGAEITMTTFPKLSENSLFSKNFSNETFSFWLTNDFDFSRFLLEMNFLLTYNVKYTHKTLHKPKQISLCKSL